MRAVRYWVVAVLAGMGGAIGAGAVTGHLYGIYGLSFAILYVVLFCVLMVLIFDPFRGKGS